MSDLPPLEPNPGVSYVMPVLNEESQLAAAVESVLAQEYAGEAEVLVVLGQSRDGTDEVAARLAGADHRVKLLRNPRNHIPVAMNIGIAASRHPVVVRVDAHSALPPGYTDTAVEVLRRTGAGNVGGRMIAEGEAPFQRAVARAYNSVFGTAGGVYHHSEVEQSADSAYLGVFRKEVLEEVGGYDETLLRGEDWELNKRIREAGHDVVFTPLLRVVYRPRSSLRALAKQMYATGAWRGHLLRRDKGMPWRFAPPPVVLALVVAAALASVAQAFGIGRGSATAKLLQGGALAYFGGVAVVGALALGGETVRDKALNGVVLATMHLSWAAGFFKGLAAGASATVDRSRLGRPAD
ncbi:MAG: glycosyltransferase family 2 protein [Propionibacteriaceae bacterium]|jgi:GT2 family glycosyltransferase|nr:glycosyltransferase family 2 protein [Propionibacteriaceae bacterium]